MSADTSPKEVAAFVRVLRQRARTGDFGAIELGDACDLIEALAARAERAEAALAARIAAEYPAALAADDAARARLAADRAAIPMTERDRRGVPLGTGAGVGGGAL